jgi:hypothetical protein
VVFLTEKHRQDSSVVSTGRKAERVVSSERRVHGAAAWWLDQTLAASDR